jgi:two-component system chemotaxis sensor kinase CheA
VQLVIEGEDTEADKNVIESLADPLIHILRNSLDHGIELPEVRLAAGKPAASAR